MSEFGSWHPNFPVNLENCHEEPIQIPGAIQNFGILIGADQNGIVRVISQNALEIFPELKDFEKKEIQIQTLVQVRENAEASRLVQVQARQSGQLKNYFGVKYEANGLQVLEIETLSPLNESHQGTAYLADLPSMMRDIQSHSNLKDLADFTARKVKALTGFDRVMIYRYDKDWNGEVVAEAKETRLESFLGLHYPASDIPPQARALYEKNWIRIIPTVNYRPSILLPKERQNLDLSNSVVRSVSPIHIRYLKNMGVGASMSISLIVDGKLWGLVACHHYSDHYVPLNIRLGCEAYGQLISWHIKTVETARAFNIVSEGEKNLHQILKKFSDNPHFQKAAQEASEDLLKLFDCSGLVIRLGDEVVRVGSDTGEIFSNAVAKSLADRSILDPLVTNEVSSLPEFAHLSKQPHVAGMMAIALSPKYNYYIICTRPEEIQTVNWAGDPKTKEKLNFGNPDERLMPRGSFALWQEIHQDRSKDWSQESVDLLKRFSLLFIKIVIERKEIVEKANSELKNLNQAKDEFVAMVSHELRTPLNAIIGWTDLALSGELENEKFPEALKIIQRNARSQNQLIGDLLDVSRIISGKMKLSVRNMRVTEIAEAVVLSFLPAADAKSVKIISQFDDNADSIIGDPGRIQQVIWNLLSNAVKFSPKGSNIWVNVHRLNSQVELQVRDQGVGLVNTDLEKIFGRFHQVDSSISRKSGGLGLGLTISKHIVELHGGRIEARSDGPGKGALFVVSFPISPILPEKKEELPIDDSFESKSLNIKVTHKNLAGEIILIVEDEPDAAKFLDLLISAHGAKTFVAHNGVDALEILKNNKEEIGIVLSDVGMPKMDGYELVKTIRQSPDKKINSICAVALTAFGRPQDRIHALKSGFDSYIAKPVMQEELITVLETVCKSKKR